jgi:histidinol-phosphate aminotransferase
MKSRLQDTYPSPCAVTQEEAMDYKFNGHIPGLNRISYITEEEAVPASGPIVDCSLGINPFGCSPTVEQAVRSVPLSEISGYPPFPYTALRKQIAEYWRGDADVPEDCIRMGNGAIGILNQINMLFVNQNTRILGYCPQFSDYMNNVYGYGGVCEFYPLERNKNYAFDCEAFLSYLHSDHVVAYLDNPNNPTGQVIPIEQIREIVRRAERMNICVIIDEAYGEFMPAANSAITLTGDFENLIVVKSFSKGFGLAGLRAGYFVASRRLMEYYQKIEIPFSINAFGQAAISAVLQDRTFIAESAQRVGAVKAELIRSCKKLVCAATGAQTSIMVLEHPDENENLHALFLRHGVITEAGEGFVGLKRSAVRIRVPVEAQTLANIIRDVENEIL